MKALFSLVLTLLLLQLSAFSSKEDTLPKTPQQTLLGTWKLAKYVHKTSSSTGTFFRNDSTIIPQYSNAYSVTFNADGTIERPSYVGYKETYVYNSPTIIFYNNGVASPSNVTSSIKQLTPDKLRIAYRKEQSGTILYDDFFYVR